MNLFVLQEEEPAFETFGFAIWIEVILSLTYIYYTYIFVTVIILYWLIREQRNIIWLMMIK